MTAIAMITEGQLACCYRNTHRGAHTDDGGWGWSRQACADVRRARRKAQAGS